MSSYDPAIKRGAFINTLGLLGKLLFPALIFVLTKLFGAETMGYTFIALTLMELGGSIAASGFMDAGTLFASPHVEEIEDDAVGAEQTAAARVMMNRVVGNALFWSLGISIAVAVLVTFFARPVIARFLPSYEALLPGLTFVAWSLPFLAFAQVVTSATKAHLRMEWDALLSGARPALLLAAGCLAWAISPDLTTLLASFLGAQIALALLALIPLSRHFDPRAVLRETLAPTFVPGLLRFALPQGLNHTFSIYNTRLDVLMLAALSTSPTQVAWYSTAAYLTSNLQQVRIVFSTALAPVVAREKKRGAVDALNRELSRAARWTAQIAVPIAIAFVVLRDDVLVLVDQAYAGAQSGFVVVLLIAPLASCLFGLAGNFVAYTGHAAVNLMNGVAIAGINTALNFFLIPRLGLIGAALATAISLVIVITAQNIELYVLERVRITLRALAWPLAGLLIATAALIFFWDPAHSMTLGARLALASALTLVAVGMSRVSAIRARP